LARPNLTRSRTFTGLAIAALAFAACGHKNSTPTPVAGDDGDDAVAIEANAAGAYTLIQDVFGGAVGTLVPVGMPYDVSLPPPTPAASSTATPIPAPLIPAVTSVSIAGDLDAGVALIVGPAASPPAIVALTSLTNAPPQYGLNVPFAGSTYTFTTGPTTPISIVRYDGVATTDGYTALIRGPGDLLSFAVTLVGSGYQFNAKSVPKTEQWQWYVERRCVPEFVAPTRVCSITPTPGHAIEETSYFAGPGRTSFSQPPCPYVAVIRTAAFGKMLVIDGDTQSSQADEKIYHESLVHPALAALDDGAKC
jgi:hypothetical protein